MFHKDRCEKKKKKKNWVLGFPKQTASVPPSGNVYDSINGNNGRKTSVNL